MLSGRRAFDVIDTAAHLSRCIRHIIELQPCPAAVIASGDLVEDGREGEYRRVRVLLAPLPMPVYLIAGNHDRRAALRTIFPEHQYFTSAGTINYTMKFGTLRV